MNPAPFLQRFKVWLGMCLFVLLAVALYWPCLNGPLLWDDFEWTTDAEPVMRDLKGLARIWFEPTTLQQYYPVTGTSFWLDYQWWGWDSFACHLHSVLLHGLSGGLFWLVLRKLNVAGAWVAAALLVAHPVMVESVAWITERKNVLSLVFFLAALLSHGRYWGWWRDPNFRGQSRWWVLGFVFFVLALLAKITAFVYPPALLLIAWWKNGKLNWQRDVRPVLPLFFVAVILGLGIAWLEVFHTGAQGDAFDLSWISRLVLAGQAFWFYLWKLLMPHPLCVIYHRWELNASQWWQWSGVAGLLFAAVLLFKRPHRGVIAAALFFAGALLPVLGFMNVSGMRWAWVADRWVHMPSLAVFALAGALLSRVPIPAMRRFAAAALLVPCCWLTWQQAGLYGNADLFWQAAINGNPNPWYAHNCYSEALIKNGRLDEAAEHLRDSVKLAPDFAEAHSNLGLVLQALGQPDEALRSFDEALRIQPDHAKILYNKALLLALFPAADRRAQAEELLLRALEAKPNYVAARNDLGNLYIMSDRLDEAERQFRQSLVVLPGNPNATAALGNIFYKRARFQEARDFYEQSLSANPDQVMTLANYAWMLSTTPDDSLRDGARAVELAERAVKNTEAKNPGILSRLAAAYAETGRFAEAVTTIQKAIEMAEASGQEGLAQNFRSMAELYQSGRAFRVGGT